MPLVSSEMLNYVNSSMRPRVTPVCGLPRLRLYACPPMSSPCENRRCIADFVDRETSRIDALDRQEAAPSRATRGEAPRSHYPAVTQGVDSKRTNEGQRRSIGSARFPAHWEVPSSSRQGRCGGLATRLDTMPTSTTVFQSFVTRPTIRPGRIDSHGPRYISEDRRKSTG